VCVYLSPYTERESVCVYLSACTESVCACVYLSAYTYTFVNLTPTYYLCMHLHTKRARIILPCMHTHTHAISVQIVSRSISPNNHPPTHPPTLPPSHPPTSSLHPPRATAPKPRQFDTSPPYHSTTPPCPTTTPLALHSSTLQSWHTTAPVLAQKRTGPTSLFSTQRRRTSPAKQCVYVYVYV